MTYTGTTLYWQKPKALTETGDEVVKLTPCLPGSGLSFGQSCVIENLWDLITGYYVDDDNSEQYSGWLIKQYAKRLADALGVTTRQLMQFLLSDPARSVVSSLLSTDKAVEQAIARYEEEMNLPANRRDAKNHNKMKAKLAEMKQNLPRDFGGKWKEKALLVESGFALPSGWGVNVTCKRVSSGGTFSKKKVSDHFIVSSDVHQEITKIKALSTVDKRAKHLQSMRLRFRIQDVKSDDKDRFPIGFTVAGTGAKVTLKEIERAGSEGIVDLATAWYRDGKIQPPKHHPQDDYETGVPPVILLCQ
jgi:hypothetical protein